MRFKIVSSFVFAAIFFLNAQAATRIELSQEKPDKLKNIFFQLSMKKNMISYSEISRDIDVKNMLHVRTQQTYQGVPVWGADAVLHIKKNVNSKKPLTSLFLDADSIDGVMYQDLQNDLVAMPVNVKDNQALQLAISHYKKKYSEQSVIKNPQSKLIVYVDENDKAHWSYFIHFDASATRKNDVPSIPTYIIDGKTLQIFEYWNDIKTHRIDETQGGGLGGNTKMGQLFYDGLQQHLSSFMIQRDAENNICYFSNSGVVVRNCGQFIYSSCLEETDYQFSCNTVDVTHNGIYWNDADAVNGAYSPSNDAFFNANATQEMYKSWMHVPVLKNPDGTPMRLVMVVHVKNFDNAFWNGKAMYFGDGAELFYPLTSLGVTAHEISHGFTEQHSELQYSRQSGGMNEAYSDMAAKAVEFYVYNKDLNWNLGSEIFKEENKAMRYFDQPSKDCKGKNTDDDCSIDDASQYTNSLDVHYSSGIYNHFFYLLSTSPDWDTKKAFILMAQANAYYWTSTINFRMGACGVLKAAKELDYDINAINKAFEAVKIDTSQC